MTRKIGGWGEDMGHSLCEMGGEIGVGTLLDRKEFLARQKSFLVSAIQCAVVFSDEENEHHFLKHPAS